MDLERRQRGLGVRLLEKALGLEDLPRADFSVPRGEEGLTPAGSISWEVFGNSVALFLGGVTAVLLELAEPRVRTGVWNHTTFRTRPLERMQRTGFAAMVTVYGPRSMAEPMIARIRSMHERVRGTTPSGEPYWANDPELLDWVHVTASFGFLEAYHRFVRPVGARERDRYYAEGLVAAELYGATGAPGSEAQRVEQFARMLPLLESSPIVLEFLDILHRTRILPAPMKYLQSMLIRAAVDLLPSDVRARLELGAEHDLASYERKVVGWLGRMVNGLALEDSPPRQASRRLAR